jgi:glycosyltransferase involved in cell wall biosynthesis
MTMLDHPGGRLADAAKRVSVPAIAPVPANEPRPLWSVMIPVHNCAPMLQRSLGSVLAQVLPPELMQIEVVDDCSTADDPAAAARAIGGDRVSTFRQERNVGHARNFNTCIARARGHYVHILHGDDWVGEGFYRRMGELLDRHARLGAAFCRHAVTNPDGTVQRVSPLERDEPGPLAEWLPRIGGELVLQPPSMVVRRSVYEALGGFDEDMRSCGEDWEMWVRIAAFYSVGFHPEILAFYRDAEGSITKRSILTGQNVKDVRLATSRVASYLAGDGAREIVRRASESWARWGLHWASLMFERNEYRTGFVQMREALLCSRSPATLKIAAGLARFAASRFADRIREAVR